jgi:hypothetical protein
LDKIDHGRQIAPFFRDFPDVGGKRRQNCRPESNITSMGGCREISIRGTKPVEVFAVYVIVTRFQFPFT